MEEYKRRRFKRLVWYLKLKGDELERFKKQKEKIARRRQRESERARKAQEAGRWISFAHQPTDSEKILARNLKKAGISFKSNQWVAGYNVDFLIPGKVIVEVEGSAHYGKEERDQRREDRLMRAGFAVLRFSNSQVKQDPEGVLKAIREKVERSGNSS